jgi:hypothetical protein
MNPGDRQRWFWIRAVGRALFYAIMGLLAALFLVMGVGGAVTASAPIYWGTFTEHDCQPQPRFGCRSIGSWESEDRTIQLQGVYLDGAPDTDGTVRASYRPTSFNSDADNNIVHVEAWSGGWLWAPWIGLLVIVGATVLQAFRWRRKRR